MNTLPFLPNEIVNKINTMAYQMHKREMQELHRAVNFNTCMKWIQYESEEYVEDWGEDAENKYDHLWEYGELVLRQTNFYQYLRQTDFLE